MMLTTEWGSTREVLRQYENDHRVLLKKLEAIKKVQPDPLLKFLHGHLFRYSDEAPFLTAKRGL